MEGSDSLQLDQFMDMVLSFKCRLCYFQTDSREAMTAHVLQEHVVSRDHEPQEPQETEDPDPDPEVPSQTPESSQLVAVGESEQQNVEMVDQVVDGTIVSQTEIMSEAREEGIAKAVESSTVDAVEPSEPIMQDTSTQIQTTEPHIKVEEPEQLTGLQDQTSEDGMQELYVCGVCSLAFDTIEKCQSHMVEQHNASNNLSVEGQISTGTQVTMTRKLGRKTKAEKAAIEAAKKKSEEPQNLKHTDLSHLSYTESRKGKRAVRPPKALVEDYQILIRKKHPPPSRPKFRLMCPIKACKAKFRSKEGLEVHRRCHEEGAAYKCPECQLSLEFWKPMQWHLWKEHRVDVDLCKCDLCDFRAENWKTIDLHLDSHDGNDIEEEIEKARMDDSLDANEDEHNSSKKEKTSRKRKLRTQQELECDICGRHFTQPNALKSHKDNVHLKKKKFECKFCTYATGRKTTLITHERTHTGEKPYKCNMCNYCASDHNTLRRHKMRHTGERAYKCGLCAFTCIQSISLKMHMKKKHEKYQNAFSCGQCPYECINKNMLEQHLEDHRRGLVEATAPAAEKRGTHLVLPMMNNVISLAAKEADLIQVDTDAQPVQMPNTETLTIANTETLTIDSTGMNMLAPGEHVVFAIEAAEDGKQYLVPSSQLSSVELVTQDAGLTVTEGAKEGEVQMVQVMVDGQEIQEVDPSSVGISQLVTTVAEIPQFQAM